MAAETILANYLTEGQAAEQLGVSVRTLKRWRALQAGPAITKVGRRVMYRRSTVAKWLEKQEAT